MSASRGGIFKEHGHWGFRFSYRDDTGQRRWQSRQGFATRALAAKYLTQALAAIDSGRGINPLKISLADYLHHWFGQYERAGRVKPTTIAEVRININAYIVPVLCANSDRPLLLGKLTREMVAEFYADLLATGRRGVNGAAGSSLSPKSVRNIAGTLRRALSDAVRRGHLTFNPADDIDLPRWDRRDLQVWESAEFAHFLQVAADHDDPMYSLWRLVVATGMRRGELLGLRWCDVDLVDATVSITQTRTTDGHTMRISTPKTRAGRRTIAIDAGTVVALAHHKNIQTAAADLLDMPLGELVASELDGRPIGRYALLDRFHAAGDRAGLPRCRLHDLRHAAAADALSRGVPVHIVAGRLGHANPATTLNIYAAFLPSADRVAANSGGSLLDRLMIESKSAPKAHRLKKAHRKRTDFERHPTTQAHSTKLKSNKDNDPITRTISKQVLPLGFEPRTCGLRVRCSTN